VIDQEAIERKDRLDQAKQTLLDKESELAGPRRFNGTINDAWKNYFNAKKEYLKDLSPLCRLIKHKEPRLSDHEKNVLRSVKPASKNGHKELEKMEKGLLKMVTERNDSSVTDIIARASSIQGSRPLVEKLSASLSQMVQALEDFQALKEEQTEIVGSRINPYQDQPLEGSKIDDINKEYNQVDSYYDTIKEQGNNRAAFIAMMSSFNTISPQFT